MDQQIETMVKMQKAEAAPEVNPTITVPKEVEKPTVNVTSAGDVWIYHTQTHEPSRCNRNMLPRKLQERLSDGTFAWDVTPHGKPHRGTIKCRLHPDAPERKHFDELGFPTCKKSNLTSMFQQEQHMKHRHPTEWETIEREQKIQEKQEEREYQRSVIGMAQRSNDGTRDNRQTNERVPGPSGQAGSKR